MAAIELRISNALIEGINSKIRLINARGYGHHSAHTLTSMARSASSTPAATDTTPHTP
nr:transposase [Mycolicibacillus koreensis]